MLDKHDGMADTKIREMNLWILQTLPPPSLWLSNTALQTPVMHSQGDAPCHLPISPHITLSGKHTDIVCCIHLVPAGEDVEEITQAGLSWHFLNNGNNAHCCHLSLLPFALGCRLLYSLPQGESMGREEKHHMAFTFINSH